MGIFLLLLLIMLMSIVSTAMIELPVILIVASLIGGLVLAFVIKFLYNLSNSNGRGYDFSGFNSFIKLFVGCTIAVYVIIILFWIQ